MACGSNTCSGRSSSTNTQAAVGMCAHEAPQRQVLMRGLRLKVGGLNTYVEGMLLLLLFCGW